MLNKQEKEKIGKVLKQTKDISEELGKIMSSLTQVRDKAQHDFEKVSAANVRIGFLEEELKGLIGEAPGA